MTFSFSSKWRSWALVLLPLLLMALAAFRPLALPDEGRYAEVGRWMAMSGDWLTPRLDGIPFFHKPPLAVLVRGRCDQRAGRHTLGGTFGGGFACMLDAGFDDGVHSPHGRRGCGKTSSLDVWQ